MVLSVQNVRPKRGLTGASGPCVAVRAGKLHLVIDAGSGGARNLTRMRFPMGEIDALLLTHFHSDHIDGMGELAMLRWVNAANTTQLPVLGPVRARPEEDLARSSQIPTRQFCELPLPMNMCIA